MTSAFTLAEVLITLAIIGIVATLTIPTLVTNYQKRELETRIKNAYTTLANGFQLMAANEGVEIFNQTQFGKDMLKASASGAGNNAQAQLAAINKYLPKYFKITNTCYGESESDCPMYAIRYKSLGNSAEEFDESMTMTSMPYFQLQDGTTFFYDGVIDGYSYIWGVDTNGEKGPNQLGRDLFLYGPAITNIKSVTDSGELKTSGIYLTTYSKLLIKWTTDTNDESYESIKNNIFSSDSYACGDIGNSDISQVVGFGCLDRIMEEGWKMNY